MVNTSMDRVREFEKFALARLGIRDVFADRFYFQSGACPVFFKYENSRHVNFHTVLQVMAHDSVQPFSNGEYTDLNFIVRNSNYVEKIKDLAASYELMSKKKVYIVDKNWKPISV